MLPGVSIAVIMENDNNSSPGPGWVLGDELESSSCEHDGGERGTGGRALTMGWSRRPVNMVGGRERNGGVGVTPYLYGRMHMDSQRSIGEHSTVVHGACCRLKHILWSRHCYYRALYKYSTTPT